MFDVLGTIAGDIKGRVAGGVLGELVAPEVRVRFVLGDPVSNIWEKGGILFRLEKYNT